MIGRVRTDDEISVSRIVRGTFSHRTDGKGFWDISEPVAAWLTEIGAEDGMLNLFVTHTTASLTIQENADPAVLRDLLDSFERLAPENGPYRHAEEGPDDMPAHIKAVLCDCSLTVPVGNGRTLCGTWQGIYLIEHRAAGRLRSIVLNYTGS